jgi:hypothetical protein
MEVKYAKLHRPLFIPGEGDYGTTIENFTNNKTKDFVMEWDNQVLKVVTKKGTKIRIPASNVSYMILAQ